MGRCCAISGCLSGRKKSQNTKKVTLFKAPKNTEMLRKWSTAMKQELKQTSFVCELHFNTNDVIKTNREVLKDGTIYVYIYEKIHLKKTAIPQLNTNNDKTKDDDVIYILPDNLHSKNIPDKITNTIITTITDKTINKTSNSNVDETNNKIVDDSTKKCIETQNSDETVNETPETSTQNSINTNIPDSIDNNLMVNNESPEFSLETLKQILETEPLRKNWSWQIIKNSFISLSYVNFKLELVCHVKIDSNLKVTIINGKTNIVADMDVNISSIDSVWQLLRSLENKFFCTGTGYDDNKCSPTCTGIILGDEAYKRRVLEYRCISCRKLRRYIQKRKKKTADYESRCKNVKYRVILERRKLKRLVEQAKNLKHELIALKNQCADEIEEEIFHTS